MTYIGCIGEGKQHQGEWKEAVFLYDKRHKVYENKAI